MADDSAEPNRAAGDEIMAVFPYRDNAELICAARDLGYLRDDWVTLDPTYGLGVFWKDWRPETLWAHDLNPEKAPDGVMDFTDLEYEDAVFDAVVFDPDYKLNGTPALDEFDERYGIDENITPDQRMGKCCHGLIEAIRVTKRRGMVLMKCQDQVVSGKKVWQTMKFTSLANSEGCRLVDQLHFLVRPRPQPEGRRQVHSRGNYSTLLVFKKES